jgi:hypothetical protein
MLTAAGLRLLAPDAPGFDQRGVERAVLETRVGKAAPVFRDRFPEAEIVFMEGAGHDLFADAGPELGRLVARWAGRS